MKKRLINKVLPVTLIVITLLVVAICLAPKNDYTLSKPNWELCLKSGMCKINAESRIPTKFDLDTKVRVNYQDMQLAVIQSRTITTGDLGKLFLVRVN